MEAQVLLRDIMVHANGNVNPAANKVSNVHKSHTYFMCAKGAWKSPKFTVTINILAKFHIESHWNYAWFFRCSGKMGDKAYLAAGMCLAGLKFFKSIEGLSAFAPGDLHKQLSMIRKKACKANPDLVLIGIHDPIQFYEIPYLSNHPVHPICRPKGATLFINTF